MRNVLARHIVATQWWRWHAAVMRAEAITGTDHHSVWERMGRIAYASGLYSAWAQGHMLLKMYEGNELPSGPLLPYP